MSLIFQEGNVNGRLVKGYEPEWDMQRSGGTYKKGYNFFSVHWEAKDRDLGGIRLHVESPATSIDPVLNKLKQDVIADIQSIDVKMAASSCDYIYKIGRKITASDIQNNKSTEVFRIILNQTQMKAIHQENIKLVHECVGSHLIEVMKRFTARINEEFYR